MALRKIVSDNNSPLNKLLVFIVTRAWYFCKTFNLRGFGVLSRTIIKLFGKEDRYCVIDIYPDIRFRINVFDGYWVPLFLDDYMYETEIFFLIRSLRTLDYLFIDCGANQGFWGLVVSSNEFGKKPFIAIEAVKKTYSLLAENMKLNNRTFPIVHKAIEEYSGQQVSIKTNLGHADASLHYAHAVRYEEMVETVCIDDLVTQHTALQKDFIILKLDVEGVEIAALKGSRQLLATKEVLIIYEDHTWDKASKVSDFVLNSLSYKVYYCDEKSEIYEMRSVTDVIDRKIEYGRGYNFMGVKPGSYFHKYLINLARK